MDSSPQHGHSPFPSQGTRSPLRMEDPARGPLHPLRVLQWRMRSTAGFITLELAHALHRPFRLRVGLIGHHSWDRLTLLCPRTAL